MIHKKTNYGSAILEGFEYLLENYSEVFVIGQGLWSPWYVGNTMTDLDNKFGKDRIIDTPVSEAAVTGAALGASISGQRPIVVHPRIDFMLYAMDAVVNEAAKWSFMFGGQCHPSLTVRGIINRGGEQGPQHSQALQSWFAHVPGLRVVMPYSVKDARDLFIASVLCDDPVIFIDDRWLYEEEDNLPEPRELILSEEEPAILFKGNDLTIIASGFSTKLACDASFILKEEYKLSVEIIDLRILSPLKTEKLLYSVNKTKRLVIVDGGWKSCGIASEIMASIFEGIEINNLKNKPLRICLPDTPAPTANILEKNYYFDAEIIAKKIAHHLNL